jgi:hypothetical protein
VHDQQMTTARRRVLVVALVVALVAAVAVGTAWYRYAHRQVLVVVDPACPPLITNTSDATDDYGDVLQWDGQTWWRSEGRTKADTNQLGVVTCTVGSIPNEHGWRVAQQGWPDGTATVLPRGTRLYTSLEDRAEQTVVARTDAGDVLYCLDDDRPGPPRC